MSMTPLEIADAYVTARNLSSWEGEYHYPNGLLSKGAATIFDLLHENAKLQSRIDFLAPSNSLTIVLPTIPRG